MDRSLHLAAELIGHEEDVRCVAIGSQDTIITGSRDKTIKLWGGSSGAYEALTTLVGHTSFVSSVAYIPAGALQQLPDGGVLSGSRDLSVIAWDLKSLSPKVQLTGHKFQVSCVAIGKQNEIISTSQDGTIRVYTGPHFSEVAELTGHEGPVQAVLVLPNGDFLTGSNDATIRLWSQGRCQHTFKGHTDTVRGLALLEGVGVVSASHDMTLRLWDFQGNVVSELVGHTAIVYSAATSTSGLVASASEDGTARVWTPDGACVATIPHPGCVWDVAFLSNNDLVTACSDHKARIWSIDASRKASADVQEAYQAAIAPKQSEASSSGAQLPAGLKLEDPSVLLQPGNKDGQIKVISEHGGGMAYSWDASEGKWEKVGQVCGGDEAGDMQMGTSSIGGKQYDHVIDVDIADGQPPLKLGVNRDDNPYDVADRFMEENGLPTTYRDQIADYIVRHTGVRVPMDTSSNPDPFTGGGAYVPSSSAPQPGRSLSGGASTSVTGGGVDPFTGGSGRTAGTASTSTSAVFPTTTMLVFDNPLNAAAVGTKICSLSSGLASAPDTASLALTDAESAEGGVLTCLLSSANRAASGSCLLGGEEAALLQKLLRWPAACLFPALDVTRLLLLDQTTATRLAESAGLLAHTSDGGLGGALATACAEPQVGANQQLGLRLLCNAFRNPSLHPWLRQQAGSILDGFSPALAAPQKAVRGAAAAFLLNLAILSTSKRLGLEVGAQALSAVSGMLAGLPKEDEDALHRGVLALGTFISGPGIEDVRQLARDLDFDNILKQIRDQSSGKLRDAVLEALQLLQN